MTYDQKSCDRVSGVLVNNGEEMSGVPIQLSGDALYMSSPFRFVSLVRSKRSRVTA